MDSVIQVSKLAHNYIHITSLLIYLLILGTSKDINFRYYMPGNNHDKKKDGYYNNSKTNLNIEKNTNVNKAGKIL